MAAAAQLLSPLVAYTNADWNEQPFAFFVGSQSTTDNFTGFTFDATLKPRGPGSSTTLSSAAGTLVITLPNIVSVAAPKATMSQLTPGAYDFELRKFSASGSPTVILRGTVTIVAGLGA